MTLRPIISILIGTVLVIVAVFFVGIFRDYEFPSEVSTFIKYRPTLQWEFEDLEAGDNHYPTAEMEEQTRRYYDFKQHQPPDLSPLLLQGILTFFVLGVLCRKTGRNLPISKILVHYICSIVLTTIGFGLLLWFYDTGWRYFISTIIVIVNLLIGILLIRKLHTTFAFEKA